MQTTDGVDRRARKAGKLSAERIARLDKAGFPWAPSKGRPDTPEHRRGSRK